MHSRSGSFSSVSSDFSSSSQASSEWSDISNSGQHIHMEAINNTGGSRNNTNNQYYTPVSYNSSPATQFPDHSSERTNEEGGTTSLACLDGGLIQQQYNEGILHQFQQSRSLHSSPQMTFPVDLNTSQGSQSASSFNNSQYASSPIDALSQIDMFNIGMMAGLASASNTATAGSTSNSAVNNSMSGDMRLSHLATAIRKSAGSNNTTEKAKINFVHGWLRQSFVLNPEGNISRHALYNAYIHVCHSYNLLPINAASYGKAVRSCWPGIKTRRLGVRGASRYHYCGIKPSNEIVKMMIDHYGSFDSENRAISCDLINGITNRSSSSERDDGGSEEMGASFSQEGLVAHMDGLNGLGISANGNDMHSQSATSNGLTSITLLPPSMVDPKIERPGSSFSSHEEHQHQQDQLHQYQNSYSEMQVPFSGHSVIREDSSSSGELALNGPFAYGNSTKSIRKQISVPTSLNEYIQQHTQQQQQSQYTQAQESSELTFADLKTPTAFHFKHNNQHNMGGNLPASGTSNKSNGSGTPSDNFPRASRLAIPMLGGCTPSSSQYSQSPSGYSSVPSESVPGERGRSQLSALLGHAASPMSRSASIPSAPSLAETFAQRFKGRRATLPDLHIKIPPLPKTNNPPSSSSSTSSSVTGSAGQGKSNESITETAGEEEEEMSQHEEEKDEIHEGKKTARLIPKNYTQSTNTPSTPDLAFPTFDDIIQSFSAKLVRSPNHPSSSSSSTTGHPSSSAASSPLANGQKIDATLSADAVIQARNQSVALLKDLDMQHAEALWELYRTSHCKGLLRLAQQGKLDEFKGAFLLFWAQLDSTQQSLVQHPVLSDAMYQADALLYPFLLTQLGDRVLATSHSSSLSHQNQQQIQQRVIGHQIPVDLLQLVHISKNLEDWAVEAFDSYPKQFADCRIEIASRTAHLMARLAGVAQLAQALSRTLSVSGALGTLLSAWEQMDFEMITNQCALVTGCPQDNIQSYLDAFYTVLSGVKDHSLSAATSSEQNTSITSLIQYASVALEEYISTLGEGSGRLSGYREDIKGAKAGDAFAAANLKLDERPLLIKWSYVSGQIMRDLIISSSPAFGSFQVLALFIEEYLAFKILKNYTLQSDNVAASIQADHDNLPGAQLTVTEYYTNSGTGPSLGGDSSSETFSNAPSGVAQGNVAKAFLVSPPTATRSVAQNQATNEKQGNGNEFTFPFAQTSANAYATTFDLSSSSMNWSPATRYLFGELALPPASARPTTSSFNIPVQATLVGGTEGQNKPKGLRIQNIHSISTTSAEDAFALLPPPTPSAFSSFPNLRSPGLSRYFPSESSKS